VLALVDISASVGLPAVGNVAAAAINLNMPLAQQRDASMSNANIIGWYINEWLAVTGMSQAELARIGRWSPGKVSMMCAGKTGYSREIIEKCANAFGIHPNELFLLPQRAIKLRRLEVIERELLSNDVSG